MATVVDCMKDLGGFKLIRKFQMEMSCLTDDEIADVLIQKFTKGPIWANDAKAISKNNKALFRLYQLEGVGLVSSKIEQKNKTRYERRFHLTDSGKKILKQ